MPLYEYECLGCQDRVERRQRFNDEPLRVCPSCGGEMRRLLFPAGIVFKGSGWYITDSRTKPPESSDSSSTSSSSGSSGAASNGSGKDASAAKDSPGKSDKAETKAASKP
jgi:putative FmdB family regulatory protein